MANIKFGRGNNVTSTNPPIEDGQILFDKTSQKLYTDDGTTRKAINAEEADKLSTPRQISISGRGIASNPTVFDGTGNVAPYITRLNPTLLQPNPGEVYAGTYAYGYLNFIEDQSTDVIALPEPEMVTIEYSKDNGASWNPYDELDVNKRYLFSNKGLSGYYVYVGTEGRADSSIPSVGYQTRITLNAFTQDSTITSKIYANVFLMYLFALAGGTSNSVTMDFEKQNTVTNEWSYVLQDVPVQGNTGPNYYTFSPFYFGGSSTQSSGNKCIRWTFKIVDEVTAPVRIYDPRLYALQKWSAASNLSDIGHLYTWDAFNKAMFPGGMSIKGTLDVGQNVIQNVWTPSNDADAANKKYVDDKVTSSQLTWGTFNTN